jgi:hypothetical protein
VLSFLNAGIKYGSLKFEVATMKDFRGITKVLLELMWIESI